MKSIKQIIKMYTPKKIWFLMLMAKSILLPNGAKSLKQINFLKNHDAVIVLGNGPSLKNDLENIVKTVDDHDFVCVNNFCSSPYYEVLKPNKYVFLDGYFFSKDAHPDWIKQRELTFTIINEKTNWKMQIFVPMGADVSILKEFIKNENVEIIKFKVLTYVNHDMSKLVRYYNTGYFGPYQCNVLLYAIYLAIWAKHKKIEIYGADLSFHNDVQVDQLNNQVQIKFRHFNSEDHVEQLMKNPQKIEPFSMYELMQTTADTFKSHDILNFYGQSKNIQILNGSSFSLIDAYKRKQP